MFRILRFKKKALHLFQKGEGFTIIELMVAVFVFVLVIITATDIFVSMIRNQARALNRQELLNQASYAVEYVSRALRMAVKAADTNCLSTAGSSYETTHVVSGVANGIKFINHNNNDVCQEFYWDSSALALEESKGGVIIPLIASDASNIKVDYFKAAVYGETDSDTYQPRTTISMKFHIGDGVNQVIQQVQTTISQRNLDIQQP
jgi:Tfp pilus assembly protein PilW